MTSPDDFADPYERLIHTVAKEIYVGQTHLYIGRHFTNDLIRHPEVARIAPTFFSLSIHAHMVQAFLHLARLFDTTRGVVNLRMLLAEAESRSGQFSKAAPDQVRDLLRSLHDELEELKMAIHPVLSRRNKLLAHLDPKTSAALALFEKEAKITFGEMESIYSRAGTVVNEIYAAYRGAKIEMQPIGIDDFEHMIHYLVLGRKAELNSLGL